MKEIKLFDNKKIRSSWNKEEEKWYFSIVDIIEILTESINPQVYWRVLKKRMLAEGNETVTNCNGLKMVASDGKYRITDVADTEQLLRLIQSIPSPKAEPFKLWLAQVGYERIEESQDPEKSIDRAMESYKNLGYSDAWINQRLKSIEVRKELTDNLTQMIKPRSAMKLIVTAFIFIMLMACVNDSGKGKKAVYVKPSIDYKGRYRKGHLRMPVSTNKNAMKSQNRSRYYYQTRGKYRRKK